MESMLAAVMVENIELLGDLVGLTHEKVYEFLVRTVDMDRIEDTVTRLSQLITKEDKLETKSQGKSSMGSEEMSSY